MGHKSKNNIFQDHSSLIVQKFFVSLSVENFLSGEIFIVSRLQIKQFLLFFIEMANKLLPSRILNFSSTLHFNWSIKLKQL